MKHILLLAALFIQWCATAQEALLKKLDSLTRQYEANGFHGVVLVAKGDQVLYEKGYGLADFDKQIRHTPATVFKTESVGKMFTAVSIMQLVEQKKLRLDQTLKELLPELVVKNADKITLHHLLNHTSGLKSPWDHPQWVFKKDYSRAALQKMVTEVPSAFDSVGKEMYYSNSGYFILAWILEKKTGLPFDAYFQKYIFDPMGMKATRHLNDTVMPANGAVPYQVLNSKRYIVTDFTLGAKASGAGGWVSTARDLYRFMYGLYSHQLIKRETFQRMLKANGTAPAQDKFWFYAYGLEQYHNTYIPGSDMIGHNGGGAGFSIDAFVDPATGYIVTSCTNLYQNSRSIAANYLNAAMGNPLQTIQPLTWVKVYDKIEAVGIDSFTANGKAYLKELNLEPNPGLFAQLGNILEQAKDFETAAKWMAYAAALYPEEPRILIMSADSQVQIGNKEAAKKIYSTAREISTKKKNDWLTGVIDEKLKSL